MIDTTAGYEIEDPSFAKHMRFCTRGSTVNVRGGNPDTSVGGVLTSVLDGIGINTARYLFLIFILSSPRS